MGVKFAKRKDTLIAKIEGELDHHVAENIKNVIDEEYTKKACKNLIFDFKNVNFMDSSGIGVIIGRYKKIKENNGKVAIVSANKQLHKIIEVSGLLRIIKCYNDIEEALKEI
ncbi:anti-sigma-factor antagonist [Thermoanaerobacter italicus Ab9]|uniref:Anti-sigma F factor antagonist n=1 Tax=Thermoanaerobacter italicus (strain DSM 9252 / Ab9) TaxID=580331 RepID=D3T8U5_THEIA|nr:anti-sigma F factor antagonist [Thermoanaerobacter italicus]ADD02377.1 anti-sigma-factor antagonist [Thermoanaerobacter italicus Ab9]